MKLEDKKKLIKKIINKCFLLIFIGFTALYLSEKTGYYEYNVHKNMILTNEKIKEFESDVKEGKNIDIKDYVDDEVYDYSNNISKMGLSISNTVNDVVKKGLNNIFKYLDDISNS